MSVSATSPAGLRRDAGVLSLVGAGHFFSHFYLLALPPLFPLIATEMSVSYAALGLLITVYNLATGVVQLPVGFIVDRYGARWTLIVGLGVMAGAITLAGLTSGYTMLLLLMLLAGVGNSVFHPADYAVMAARIDHQRLGRAFSIHTALGHAGWAVAPAVMITLTALWSWHTALVIVGLAGLVVMLAMLANGHLLDAPTEREQPTVSGGGLMPAGIATLMAPPVLLFFGFMVFAAFANAGLTGFAVSALVTLYDVKLTVANAALTVLFVASTTGILVGGVIADKTRHHDRILALGFFASAAALVVIGVISLPVILITVAFALSGFMLGAIRPSRDMMVRAVAPDGQVGKIFGFVTVGLNVGGAIAPVLFGWMIDQGGAEWVFFGSAVCMLLAVASALIARRSG